MKCMPAVQVTRCCFAVIVCAHAFGLGLPYAVAAGQQAAGRKDLLHIQGDEKNSKFEVFREHGTEPLVTQVALPDERPYIHPILAPDGNGVLTEYRPAHHPHQTGIFWGLKLVNGRDFFMKWQGDYYRRVSASVLRRSGEQVKWQTVYDMLDEKGEVVITETQTWSMQPTAARYLLNLDWQGKAPKGRHNGQVLRGWPLRPHAVAPGRAGRSCQFR